MELPTLHGATQANARAKPAPVASLALRRVAVEPLELRLGQSDEQLVLRARTTSMVEHATESEVQGGGLAGWLKAGKLPSGQWYRLFCLSAFIVPRAWRTLGVHAKADKTRRENVLQE